jgi:hypothetical protein
MAILYSHLGYQEQQIVGSKFQAEKMKGNSDFMNRRL